MALNLYYGRIKDEETKAALCPEGQAHDLLQAVGFGLMNVGVRDITEKSIDDVVRRFEKLHELGHPTVQIDGVAYCPPRAVLKKLLGYQTNVSQTPYGAWLKSASNPRNWMFPGDTTRNATMLQEAVFWQRVLDACEAGTPFDYAPPDTDKSFTETP